MSDCEKYKALLMGLIDGELTPDEAHEVNSHLTRCAHCRKEYEEIAQDGERLGSVTFVEPTEAELNRLWKAPYSRFAKTSGLLLVLLGWITLVGYAVYEVFRDTHEPLFSRVAVGAVIIGFVVLLFNVIRERMITYGKDPYREVDR